MKTKFGLSGNLTSLDVESFPARPEVEGGYREPVVRFTHYNDDGSVIGRIGFAPREARKIRDAFNEFLEEVER